jgi:hypothetical protein
MSLHNTTFFRRSALDDAADRALRLCASHFCSDRCRHVTTSGVDTHLGDGRASQAYALEKPVKYFLSNVYIIRTRTRSGPSWTAATRGLLRLVTLLANLREQRTNLAALLSRQSEAIVSTLGRAPDACGARAGRVSRRAGTAATVPDAGTVSPPSKAHERGRGSHTRGARGRTRVVRWPALVRPPSSATPAPCSTTSSRGRQTTSGFERRSIAPAHGTFPRGLYVRAIAG